MNTKLYTRSFAGGEVAPQMAGRVDDPRRQNGVARMRNFLPRPTGTVRNRPGTAFVRAGKHAGKKGRLIPFRFSNEQALVVELGEGYFRFHSGGQTLLSGAPPPFLLSQQITAYDFALEQFDTLANHGFTTGDELAFGGTAGAVLPDGIAFWARFFAIVVDANTVAVASSLANALAGVRIPLAVGASAGTHFVHRLYRRGALVSFGGANHYCTVDSLAGTIPFTFPARIVSAAANVFTLVNHSFFHGAAITFDLAGGTLPPEIVPGVTYYVIPLTANTFSVSATWSSAVLTFAGSSTGNPTVTGLNPWYQQPASGEYEIPNPYAEAHLFAIGYAQSGDVLTLVHTNYREAELRRFSATEWDYTEIPFGSAVSTPTGVAVSPFVGETIACVGNPTGAGGNYKIRPVTLGAHHFAPGQIVFGAGGAGSPPHLAAGYAVISHIGPYTPPPGGPTFNGGEFGVMEIIGGAQITFAADTPLTLRPVSLVAGETQKYKVTAVDQNGIESPPSAEVTATNNLTNRGASNRVTWNVVAGAAKYNVYKEESGNFGLIGQTEALFFSDDNIDGRTIAPDMGRTPPFVDLTMSFTQPGNQAGAVGYHEQRRVFAGFELDPLLGLGSRTGTESDFSYHLPVQATDRVRFKLSGEPSQVRHILSLQQQMVLLTASAELAVLPIDTTTLQGGSVRVQRQSDIGAAIVRPIVVGSVIVFVGARDHHVYELGFREEAGGYVPGDLSIRALHLFDGLQLADSAHMKAPWQVLFWPSTDGGLLSFTYVPQEQVGSWARQGFNNGAVESSCVIPEGNEDRLYLFMRRTINGQVVRYIERLGSLAAVTAIADGFFVDAGVSYAGAPTTTVSAPWLAGQEVAVFADGVVLPRRVLPGSGLVTLQKPASKIAVGIPIRAEIETLPLAIDIEGAGQGRQKNVTQAHFRVVNSARFQVGPDEKSLTPITNLSATELRSLEAQVALLGRWTDSGSVLVRHDDPTPLEIVNMTQEVAVA